MGSQKITVRFAENYNKKLYGNYFTTLRKNDYPVKEGDLVEIELKGIGIMLARCVKLIECKFHDIPDEWLMCDTGMVQWEYLELFKKFGMNVNDFNLRVKCYTFCVEQVYKRNKS